MTNPVETNDYVEAYNAVLKTLDRQTTNVIHEPVEHFENIDSAKAQLVSLFQTYFLTSETKIKRKDQLLNILLVTNDISMIDLADQMGISRRNISSQLTYLRRDGYVIDVLNRNGDRIVHLETE